MRCSQSAIATASAIRARTCSRAIARPAAGCFAPIPAARSTCALRREPRAWRPSAIAQGATGTTRGPAGYNSHSAFERTRRTSMKRVAAALTVVLVAGLLAAPPARGQQYPNKPIRIVVPFAAGGTSDILARAIGPHITTAWGQPVIVETRAGPNGMLATYPSVKGGRLKGLAVSSAQRVPSAPELPTVAETLPGFETGSYQGLLAAAGTPREIVTKLNAELTRILNTNDMKEFLAKQGTEVRAGTPEALGTFIVNEKARWAKVVKEAGVKAD